MSNEPADIQRRELPGRRSDAGTKNDGGRHVRRMRLPLLATVFGLALLAACGGGDGRSPTPTSPTTAAPTSSVATGASTTARADTTKAPTRPTVTEAPAAALANGTHPVYLTAVDTGRRTIGVDLVELVDRTSAEAAKICPELVEGGVDGYCIKNVSSRGRTLSVPSTASISVLNGSGLRKVDLAGLAAARRPQKEDSFFEVTVAGGKVTVVKELYRA